MGRLDGKVALVTGSGRGIGKAIALKLAREGANLVVNDLDEGPSNEVVALINRTGGQAVAVNGSISDEDFGSRFVNTALDRFNGLDIIVNNAGYTWDSTIQNHTNAQFDAMIEVHLVAPFKILRAAAEPIRAMAKAENKEGREVFRKIVNISSIAGLYGNAGQVSYSAAKSGLIGLTRTLAKEWGRFKVNINCVAFGLIQTRLTEAIELEQNSISIDDRDIKVGIQPHLLEVFNSLIPLGRAGTPEEAADAVYLFCSPEANYISGQVIVCGGGLII